MVGVFLFGLVVLFVLCVIFWLYHCVWVFVFNVFIKNSSNTVISV